MVALHIFFIICGICNYCEATELNRSVVTEKVPIQRVTFINDTYTTVKLPTTVNNTAIIDNFIAVLLDVTTDQIKDIKRNVMTNYDLYKADIAAVSKAIADVETKYLDLIKSKYQTMMQTEQVDVTDHFMIDFMDVSNFILEKVLDHHMQNVRDKGKMGSLTKWNRHTLKQKILRQQIKIATNTIEIRICERLKVCKDRPYYSDYLVVWIRSVMTLGARGLKRFFMPLPEILEKHKHIIKSNIKFRQTIKYLITANAIVKRDTLDFVDEIITNPDNVLRLASPNLKKSVNDLRELFVLLDGAYDVNVENVIVLRKISDWMKEWIEGTSFDVHKIMNAIVENMDLNMKIWPLDVQKKLYYIWSEVISL
ncbi:uncharacterized protein LOC142986345 [Anticarsia gemmatalis]|uniref:uncharacterized protein LOC142986345 n=1 Tax=Anticarsia gemmatalis TaxID=129554 RepID=UPI003F762797